MEQWDYNGVPLQSWYQNAAIVKDDTPLYVYEATVNDKKLIIKKAEKGLHKEYAVNVILDDLKIPLFMPAKVFYLCGGTGTDLSITCRGNTKYEHLIIDYVEGVTLTDYIQTASLLDILKILYIIFESYRDTAQVEFTHYNLVPANIIVDTNITIYNEVLAMNIICPIIVNFEQAYCKGLNGYIGYVSPNNAANNIYPDIYSPAYDIATLLANTCKACIQKGLSDTENRIMSKIKETYRSFSGKYSKYAFNIDDNTSINNAFAKLGKPEFITIPDVVDPINLQKFNEQMAIKRVRIDTSERGRIMGLVTKLRYSKKFKPEDINELVDSINGDLLLYIQELQL